MFKLGTWLILGLIASAVVYQLIARIPTDALNVALGVACGVGASIPVSVGLLIALTRQRRQNDQNAEWQEPDPVPARMHYAPPPPRQPQRAAPSYTDAARALPPQPQIIVIAPPQGQFPPGQMPQNLYGGIPLSWLQGQPAPAEDGEQTVDARDWRIIGE